MKARTAAAMILPAVAATALVTAGPAFAKSDVSLSVSSHRVHVGHHVRVSATGGNDDAGDYTQVCVQIERHRHWHDLRCSRPVSDDSGAAPTVTVWLRERHRTTAHLRAQLFEIQPGARRGSPDQWTPTTTVRFVR